MMFAPPRRNRTATAVGRVHGPTIVIKIADAEFRLGALVAEVATRGDWRAHVANLRLGARLARAHNNPDQAGVLDRTADQLEENALLLEVTNA